MSYRQKHNRARLLSALSGYRPRTAPEPHLANLTVEPGALEDARLLTKEATQAAVLVWEELTEDLRPEHPAPDLSIVEGLRSLTEEGLEPRFRRVLAIAYIALDLHTRVTVKEDDLVIGENPLAESILATHRAVEARWTGGTHDLSNCLCALHSARRFERPLRPSIGAWVWSSVGLVGAELASPFAWMLASKRLEYHTGMALHERLKDAWADATRRPRVDRLNYREVINSLYRVVNARVLRFGNPLALEDDISQETACLLAIVHIMTTPGAPGQILEAERGDRMDSHPNVPAKDEDFWYRQWVLRFETPGEGSSLIMTIDRENAEVSYYGPGDDDGGRENDRQNRGELSEAEIRRIAYDHLRKATDVPGAIREIVRGDRLAGDEPRVYGGPAWERQWIVYFERNHPSGHFMIGPSLIMAIDRETGEVTYYGSANDEG